MTIPIVWTIAGSDPSGGAGIQADLKTMNQLGVHGCSVITALIAQNTKQIALIEYPAPEMITRQLQVLEEDLPASVIKIGMLGNPQTTEIVSSFIRESDAYTVFDPVLVSTSGTILTESDSVDIIKKRLFPHISLLTPNIPEAAYLTGTTIRNTKDIEETAKRILQLGVPRILIKGGHQDSSDCRDYYTDGTETFWITSTRVDSDTTHGSGCILSSAIASCIALGYPMPEALTTAKAYVHQAIRNGLKIGTGRGVPRFQPLEKNSEFFPTIGNF